MIVEEKERVILILLFFLCSRFRNTCRKDRDFQSIHIERIIIERDKLPKRKRKEGCERNLDLLSKHTLSLCYNVFVR